MTTVGLPVVPPGASLRLPLTPEEFRALGETKSTEYVGGVALVNPPNLHHVRAVRRLGRLLEAATPPAYEVLADWGWQPPDVAPDFYRPDLLLADPGPGETDMLHHPPLLVIEVLSPSTRDRDEHEKRRAYAQSGALWYWLADPAHASLVVLRADAGRFTEVQRLGRPGRTIGPIGIDVDPGALAAPP